MTLRIYPATQPYDPLFEELVASIPPGTQWHRGNVVLPLSSSDSTPFQLEGTVGDHVEVLLNNTRVTSLFLSEAATTIHLRLGPGKNSIQLRSESETYFTLVVAVNYATLLRGLASEFFYSIDVKYQDTKNQLNSELSLRAVEHQIDFQDLLPSTRAMRVLAGKMAVRALVNEVGTTRGVDDIASAASGTTPVVVPTQVDPEIFEPDSRPLFSTAHDEGGFTFHVWSPNVCVGTWAAFIRLMDNLRPPIAELVKVSDDFVTVDFLGTRETHSFDFEAAGCSIVSLLTQDCLPITVSALLNVHSELAFCAWRYPFDVVVGSALGRYRLDSLGALSSIVIPSSVLQDTDGSQTGIVGAFYTDLPGPVTRVISATVIDPFGSYLISAFGLPGTSRVVLSISSPPRYSISLIYEGPLPFDSGVSLDSAEESDPLSDGWYGLPLVDRFDGGHCLDTSVPSVTLFEDLACCFDGPSTTLAVSSLTSISLALPSLLTASLVIS